jgi:hypothetical protein
MAPAAGTAAAGPIGTGMTLSGARFDTVMDNKFVDNGAWGMLMVPYAQEGKPSLHQTCKGIGSQEFPGFGCVMDPEGDALIDNTFSHDGYFHNPSNSDFGQITLFGGEPANCFAGNHYPNGSSPSNLEKTMPACGGITKSNNTGGNLFPQVLCDTGFGACTSGMHYPKVTGKVIMKPLPKNLPTMPHPCSGVPANPWCPRSSSGGWGAYHTTAIAAVGLLALPAVARRRKSVHN